MTYPAVPSLSLFERLNAALPQTQCTRCGYPDCAAYAEAIASGEAAINQCPPGGEEGVQRLAAITGLAVQPLNPAHGVEGPRAMAVIDENWCIGCTLCLDACPTDAILGSNKLMHTVIEPYCTGCELCIPVCPVDCISLENASGLQTGWNAWSAPQADVAHARYALRTQRLGNPKKTANTVPLATSERPVDVAVQTASTAFQAASRQPLTDEATRKRAVIDAALMRAREKAQRK